MFITFEGIEGVGKTTQLKALQDYLKGKKIPVITTREPGGTVMGEEIRDVLLKHRHEVVDPMTELLLMFAARAQHVATIIQPALKKGEWVLCDRFLDASYAYQGGGRGMMLNDIQTLEKLVLKGFKPDLTFLLDAPISVGFKRIKGRGGHADRFEQEKSDFYERVRNHYLERAELEPQRFVVVDATRDQSDVTQSILQAMSKWVEQLV